MTINFPWGSLLRGVLGHDPIALAGVAALLAPGAIAHILVSLIDRDGVPPPAEDLEGVYAAHGLEVLTRRAATAEEIAASGSTWAKRLRAGSPTRPVTLLRVVAR